MMTAMKINKNPLNWMIPYSVYDDTEYRLPVFYICGRDDWQTPSIDVENYFERIKAPQKRLIWVENAGHMALVDNHGGYNDALMEIIEEMKKITV